VRCRTRLPSTVRIARGYASWPSVVTRSGVMPVNAFADWRKVFAAARSRALARHHVNQGIVASNHAIQILTTAMDSDVCAADVQLRRTCPLVCDEVRLPVPV
jgi:hypothetical protein